MKKKIVMLEIVLHNEGLGPSNLLLNLDFQFSSNDSIATAVTLKDNWIPIMMDFQGDLTENSYSCI